MRKGTKDSGALTAFTQSIMLRDGNKFGTEDAEYLADATTLVSRAPNASFSIPGFANICERNLDFPPCLYTAGYSLYLSCVMPGSIPV